MARIWFPCPKDVSLSFVPRKTSLGGKYHFLFTSKAVFASVRISIFPETLDRNSPLVFLKFRFLFQSKQPHFEREICMTLSSRLLFQRNQASILGLRTYQYYHVGQSKSIQTAMQHIVVLSPQGLCSFSGLPESMGISALSEASWLFCIFLIFHSTGLHFVREA